MGIPCLQVTILCNILVVSSADLFGMDEISTHFVKVSTSNTTYILPSGAGGSIPTTVSMDHY